MSKIVFLFGAGASCQALPIVNQIADRLEDCIQKLQTTVFILPDEKFQDLKIDQTKRHIQELMMKDFQWILELTRRHASIDTAAKKLYVTQQWRELLKLKLILSIFFIVEQLNKQPDPRYDTFYASILGDSNIDFPKHIDLLSWNYDLQFELSFVEYSNDKRFEASRSYLNIITKFDYRKDRSNRCSIFKLNGDTCLLKDRGYNRIEFAEDFGKELNIDVIEKFVRLYALGIYYHQVFYPGLSFAWERQGNETSIVKYSAESLKDAEVLVVIGYSFPFFNREVDREIIGNMKELKSVYIQAPDAPNIVSRFYSIRPDLNKTVVNPITDVYQFFLPPEL